MPVPRGPSRYRHGRCREILAVSRYQYQAMSERRRRNDRIDDRKASGRAQLAPNAGNRCIHRKHLAAKGRFDALDPSGELSRGQLIGPLLQRHALPKLANRQRAHKQPGRGRRCYKRCNLCVRLDPPRFGNDIRIKQVACHRL